MAQRAFNEFEHAPWDLLPAEVLHKTQQVPTMLSAAEQRLYYWLTREWMRGDGAVVDLGCFVGGSTARLAAGHQDARHDGLIYAFDQFGADETVKRDILYKGGIAPFSGENILELAQSLLEPWTERISLHPGLIQNQVWRDGPIELLAMDASKSVATMDAMAEIFFPALIPGHSLVIQQDFLHWRQPWIAMQMALMSDYFKPVAHCPDNTVIFINTREIDDDALCIGRVGDHGRNGQMAALRKARRAMRKFGLADRLVECIHAVKANPMAQAAHELAPRI